ncbi:hypothetical protein GGI25_004925 [Coemansia spiralis]|uniref:Derlin n=2 Tax=Coemansia TaxID=4863 RepID=A0A9W8G385_9FUNG|nr:Der1-like family-domain-containing protein [Coemansia spiralis]KAJ1988638.1 hypothetical protein EDC05_005186 [Coemansia umbellata]KAJ2622428.1 hypothetical protein GGI26_003291 [Coemansia sp. RSA 1358]KAJ2672882.1 hypothetical protein GGI25_004925 [Coemansia spiralis]
MPNQLEEWYFQIPLCTRIYLTATVALTLAVQMEWVTPYELFHTYSYTVTRGEYWRIVTTFLFLGRFSLDWILNVYFIVRHCKDLEEGSYLTKPADFAWLMLLMCGALILISPLLGVLFLGNLLVLALTYVWSRHYSYMFLNIMGVFTIPASYFPWVMIAFSLVAENRWPFPDLAAIGIGHLFWFLSEEWPRRAESGGSRPLQAPKFLCRLMDQDTGDNNTNDTPDDAQADDGSDYAGSGSEEQSEHHLHNHANDESIIDDPSVAQQQNDGAFSLHQRAPYARDADDS